MHSNTKPPSAHAFAGLARWAVAGSLAIATGIVAGSAARAQASADGVFAVTYLDVAPSALGQGIDLLKKYRESSQRETANLEFTVLQEMHRPNRFVIVEGWKDQAAFDAHDKGAAKAAFQDALTPIRNSPPDRHMLQPFANAATRPAPASGSLYMVEHIDFMGGDPAYAAAAQPLVKGLAESTRKEEGAVRYEIYRQPPPRINHYEVVSQWRDAKAFDAHETAPHTLQFRADSVKDTRAPRVNLYDQRLYSVL